MISPLYFTSIKYNSFTAQLDLEGDIIGIYNPLDGSYTTKSSAVFMDGTTNIPSEYPPPNILSLSMVAKGILIAGAVLFIVFCIAMLVFYFLAKQKFQSIRASSVRFSSFIYVGASLALLSIPFNVNPQIDGACGASTFLLDIGLVAVFGAIFVKSIRIHMIFNRTLKTHQQSVKDEYLVRFVLVFVAIQTAIDIGMVVENGANGQLFLLDRNDYYMECPSPTMWTIGRLIIPLLLIFACSVLAFFVRKIERKIFNGIRVSFLSL